jgi:aryl-alcohol dehydrogenase-like predicted oxidoreductase
MANTAASSTSSPERGTAARAGTLKIGDRTVVRLGFGAMRITGEGIWGPPADREEAKAVLRRALELGVNFIDTADAYGPYVSEELIAEALYPYPSDLMIATKGGFERSGPGQWHENGRPEHLREACEGSLRRLRVEQIDLYQLHRIDPSVPADEQFGVLRDLQEEGKIKHVGLSEVGTDDLRSARRVVPIVSVQNRYSFNYRKWDDVVVFCEEAQLAFIPWRPIGGGGKDGVPDVVKQIAERHGATPMQVAIAWLLARSPVMLPIPGTSSVAHLDENLASAALTLAEEDLDQLNAINQ